MRVHDMVVAERLHAAELLAGLTSAQMRTQSLCDAWSVREVGAHLASYLRFGQLKIYTGVMLGLGDLGPANRRLARHYARDDDAGIVDRLARNAHSRITVPRSGYDPVLADVVLHDLDVRIPLGLARQIPEEHLLVSFHHLANEASPGYAMGDRLTGLRIEATDTGWSAGRGAPVRGGIEDVLLSISGRRVALDRLDGDGAEILRRRVLAARPLPVGPRMATVLRLLVSPSARKSKQSRAPDRPDAG